MSVRTKTPPTKAPWSFRAVGPSQHAQEAKKVLTRLGFRIVEESLPWREAFPEVSDIQLPGVILRGARGKEGLTQLELAKRTGLPQRHISEMENGKRPIGKANAKKFAGVLRIGYKVFL